MAPESVTFDRAAGYYDETRGFPPGVEDHAAALLVEAGGLTATSRVLDVGTGTGLYALPLARHVGMVAGVDISALMLRRLVTKRQREPVFVSQGIAERLPFGADTFDAVVAVHVFHLIPGWQNALHDVARVLAPGGLLLSGVNDANRRAVDPLWRVWDATVRDSDPVNVGVPRAKYATFLEEMGWQPVGEPRVYHYSRTITPYVFIDRLKRRVWSSCWLLDDVTINAGLAALHAFITAEGIDPQKPLTLPSNFTVRAFAPPGR
ncbi:MAG: class I SAM-dependent methyltransferase [Anaerolineae bacterium]|nr:class I SAM-dependent methyltransferase [Anaerolineae bacterium]